MLLQNCRMFGHASLPDISIVNTEDNISTL
jgi:hypothetical protein